MEKIVIRPNKYRQFGLANQECRFYLITDLVDTFVIEQDGIYKSYDILIYSDRNLLEIIQQTE